METLADNFSHVLGASGASVRHIGELTGRHVNRTLTTIIRGDDFRLSSLLDIAHALGYRVEVRFVKALDKTAGDATQIPHAA